ncbi:hypothetical protein [Nannocystis pusilla]|uniref:hypothetical protein n=1 Tax=Nannocystis pusilla TaxID=889268 RepID=UPI003B7E48F5
MHALLEEYPATAALLGVPAVDAFFSTPAFRTCAFEHGSMALSFGTWLGDQAGGPGRIEAAIAGARRPRPGAGGAWPATRASPRCWSRSAAWPASSASAAASAPTRPPRWRRPARRASDRHAGPIASRCWSKPARAARCPRDSQRAAGPPAAVRRRWPAAPALAAEAVRLGAEAHEADELLAGLVADGLLVAR